MTITIKNDFDVDLVEVAGSDRRICQAARVSTLGFVEATGIAGAQGDDKLIGFLMRGRHGSPFEHNMLTFRITAPIFVWREFMRHRVGVSYNEQSGRYMEMLPVFYIPPPERNLTQVGKPGHYTFEPGTKEQISLLGTALGVAYSQAWLIYQDLLGAGIAKEVARVGLPLAIYSSAYVTMNARSLMHFLGLRTTDPTSMFPSYPQWEIEQVARQMEALFAQKFPITHKAFCDSGRVCP